jgi:uncharacterized protein YndB with AHSA1/START domain
VGLLEREGSTTLALAPSVGEPRRESPEGRQMTAPPSGELRFADGPSTEVDVLIDASPEAVWALVADIQLPARFSDEFLGATWTDGGADPEPRVGRRFVGRNRHPAIGEWETTAVVVECEPPRVLGWVIGEPEQPSASWRFTLAPEGERTRLAQWMRVGPARSGINLAIDAMPDKEGRILRRRLGELHANMAATLQGIKAAAEREPRAAPHGE